MTVDMLSGHLAVSSPRPPPSMAVNELKDIQPLLPSEGKASERTSTNASITCLSSGGGSRNKNALRPLFPVSVSRTDGSLPPSPTKGKIGVEGFISNLLVEVCKQSANRVTTAKDTIRDNQQKLCDQTKKQLEEIDKRINGQKKSGFWSSFVKVFKTIATALSAISSIATGPVGLAGSAALVTSLVLSLISKNKVATWISLGLNMASAGLTLGGSYASSLTKVGQGGKTALGKLFSPETQNCIRWSTGIGTATTSAGSMGASVMQSHHEGVSLGAQAKLTELQLSKERLSHEVKTEQSALKHAAEYERCIINQASSLMEAIQHHSTHDL